MTVRRNWVVIPGFVALGAIAAMLSAYSGASSSQGASPTQPIPYSHVIHVQQLKMNCLYCHFAANKSPDPGLPAVETCMGCHTLIAAKSPNIVKLTSYANKHLPVPWIRIHKLPEYVHFRHDRHVAAGVKCQTCHGEIQTMQQVYQAKSLNMGWCVSCHIGQSNPPFKARYDCSVCHY